MFVGVTKVEEIEKPPRIIALIRGDILAAHVKHRFHRIPMPSCGMPTRGKRCQGGVDSLREAFALLRPSLAARLKLLSCLIVEGARKAWLHAVVPLGISWTCRRQVRWMAHLRVLLVDISQHRRLRGGKECRCLWI